MAETMITGKVIRVLPTETFKFNNADFHTRKIWIEDHTMPQRAKPNVLEVTVTHTDPPQSPNFTNVEELDKLENGHLIRFVCQLAGSIFKNRRTGQQQVWNRLQVVSRIERLESVASYVPKAAAKAVRDFQHKQLVAAQAQAVLDGRDPDEVSVQ